MSHTAVVGLIILASLAGCSHLRPSPAPAMPAERPVVSPGPPSGPSAPPAPPTEPKPASEAAQPIVAPTPAAPLSRPEPAPAPATPIDGPRPPAAPGPVAAGKTSTTTAAIARPPEAQASKPPPASTTPVEPPASKPAAASAGPAAAPAQPALDLAALEQRLRDTRAIGLFTKLSLKNQVDELLGQFRAHYRANKVAPPPQLRQRYDGLLLKVLSVLQDGDPPLAAQIWASREAIWGVLADPAKFEKI